MAQDAPFLDWTGRPLRALPQGVRASVSAFIQDAEGRVLLHRRADNGYWALPGGGVEPGESVAEACMREVREETGLIVRVGRLIGVYSDPRAYAVATYPDGTATQFVNLCFACEVVAGTLQHSAESTAIGFFALDALPQPLLPAHRLRIEDALRASLQPWIR